MKTTKTIVFVLFFFAIQIGCSSFTTAQSWKELDSLGTKLDKEGKYKEAIEIFEKAKQQAEKEFANTHQNYGISLRNLGRVYARQANYTKSETLLLESLNIISSVLGKEHDYYCSALNELALLYLLQGNYSKAETTFIQVKDIAKKIFGEGHSNYASILSSLGAVYTYQNNFSKAEPIFLNVLQIQKKEGNEMTNSNHASTLNNLAYIYERQNYIPKADSLYKMAISIRKKVLGDKHPIYANSLNNLGIFYVNQRKYDLAEPVYLEALKIRKEMLGETHPNYILSLESIAVLYNYLKSYEKSVPIFNQVVHSKLNELKNNFAIFSEIEKTKYLDANRRYFWNFYGGILNIWQDQPNLLNPTSSTQPPQPNLLQTAINTQLQIKGILLSETSKMKKRILASGDSNLINQFETWQAVKNSISKAYNLPIAQREKQGIDISKLENEANELERNLSLRSADFKEAFNPPTYTFQDLQKKLKKNELAIELIRTEYKNTQTEKADTAYLALIVTQSEIKPLLLKNAKALETASLGIYKQRINLQATDTISYRAYWSEIEKNLPSSTTKIYICPDGVYNQINLNTLLNSKNNQYLLEKYDIQVVTNLKEILNTPQNTSNKTALLLGRPQYNMQVEKYQAQIDALKRGGEEAQETKDRIAITEKNWKDLPATETEVKMIEKQLQKQKWTTETVLGEQAIEERVKQIRNPAILHLATHGYFTPTDSKNIANAMLNSGVVLAGINTQKSETAEDGVLTAYEVMNLNLDQTDLVVLSACETGLGEVSNGEGVYGLQRAFIVAGAKSLIISLWKVGDVATSELMTTFYKHYLKSGKKRESFIKAQKQLKKRYKHPYFWGGFVMIGE